MFGGKLLWGIHLKTVSLTSKDCIALYAWASALGLGEPSGRTPFSQPHWVVPGTPVRKQSLPSTLPSLHKFPNSIRLSWPKSSHTCSRKSSQNCPRLSLLLWASLLPLLLNRLVSGNPVTSVSVLGPSQVLGNLPLTGFHGTRHTEKCSYTSHYIKLSFKRTKANWGQLANVIFYFVVVRTLVSGLPLSFPIWELITNNFFRSQIFLAPYFFFF